VAVNPSSSRYLWRDLPLSSSESGEKSDDFATRMRHVAIRFWLFFLIGQATCGIRRARRFLRSSALISSRPSKGLAESLSSAPARDRPRFMVFFLTVPSERVLFSSLNHMIFVFSLQVELGIDSRNRSQKMNAETWSFCFSLPPFPED